MAVQAVLISDADQAVYRSLPVFQEARKLGAWRALIIFLAYFAGQVIGSSAAGIFGGVFVGFKAASSGVRDSRTLIAMTEPLIPWTMGAGMGLGALLMVLCAIRLVPADLRRTEPTGAAWRIGRIKWICYGLGIGGAGALVMLLFSIMCRFAMFTAMAPVMGKMAVTPGAPQIIFAVCALFIAPLFEELLFRGVLYGGFRKTFGPIFAALFVTSLFVLCHLDAIWVFPPAAIGIGGMGAVALWLRLRTGTLGPSVAMHLAFNSLPVFLSTVISQFVHTV